MCRCLDDTLLFAASNGYIDIMKMMLEKGANINIRSKETDHWTPLMKAVKNEQLGAIKFLLKNGAKVNLKNDNEETALLLSWNKDIIKLLLENGADVNAKDIK